MSLSLEAVASGVLRHRHYVLDPVSAQRERTVLLEGQRTNLLLRSNELDNAYWTLTRATIASETDPRFGTVWRLTSTDGSTAASIRRSSAVLSASANSRAGAVLAKYVSGSPNLRLNWRTADNSGDESSVIFDLQTGIATISGGPTLAKAVDCGDGWWLLLVGSPGNATGGSTSFQLRHNAQGVGDEVLIAHAQLEDNVLFPSSRIVTVASTATRSADALSLARLLPTPQEMTAYLDVYNVGAFLNAGVSRVLFQTGAGGMFEDDQLRLVVGGQAAANAWGAIDTDRSLAYAPSLKRWVALSPSGVAMYSDDGGRSWALGTVPEANGWRSVAWSSDVGRFVAVADSGTNRVMWSADGKTWTAAAAAAANSWRSICWAGGSIQRFVAVSTDGTNRTMHSTNGESWTAVAAAEANQWTCVCWSSDLDRLVAVAQTGTNRVMYSDDPTTSWTAAAASAANSWHSVTWAGGSIQKFVACASTGSGRVMWDADGAGTWTAVSSINSTTCRSVTYSPELDLVMVVATGTGALHSTDALAWSVATMPAANTWASVEWGGGNFVAVSTDGINRVARSTDGGTWTAAQNLYAQLRVGGITYVSEIPLATLSSWAYGDRVRLNVQLREDGAGQYELVLSYKLNGGAWTAMSASSPFDLPSAWTDDTINVGSRGDGVAPAFMALRRLRFEPGVVAAADMEALVG